MKQGAANSGSLCSDQRRRWRRGDAVRVEAYLEQDASLGADDEALLDLIYNEIVLRQERGDEPRLEEYLGRFGRLGEPLRLLFEVHEALEKSTTEGSEGVEAAPSVFGAAAALPPVRVLPRVPGYDVLDILGEGGMGVVYRARHQTLQRPVALKMLQAGAHATGRDLDRFQTEARVVARLQHPNIVPIYEVGEHDGQPFLALELVEGGSLTARIAGTPQPARDAAGLVAALAHAMHYAHGQDVVHRDLKPANVLLTGDGVPRITDFGLAKHAGSSDGPTRTGDLLGTPSYMAPEQALGRLRDVGPRTDVYALGAILYELLTGRPPFKAETATDTLLQVLRAVPVPPSRLRTQMPRDLETIVLKCLEKEPRGRYDSALDLAEDLERFLDGLPIRARRSPPWERMAKWARRRSAAAALWAVSALALAGLLLAGGVYAHSERQRLALEKEEGVRQAQQTYRHFLRLRDEAYDRSLYPPGEGLLAGADSAGGRKATEAAARAALAAVGVSVEADSPWAPDPAFTDPAQREEIATDCYALLLVWADAVGGERPAGPERWRQALRIIERAPAIHAPTAAYRLRRAHYRKLLGEGDEAAAADLQPAGAIDHFLIGYDHYQRGHIADARRAFDAALAVQPDHFQAQYYLAACHLSRQEWDQARAAVRGCLAQRPDSVWLYLMRGWASCEQGAWADAEADYDRARRLLADAADGEALYLLDNHRGVLRYRQNRLPEAIAEFQEAAGRMPGRFPAHANLALVYVRQRRWAEVEREVEEAYCAGAPPATVTDLLVTANTDRAAELLDRRDFAGAVDACQDVLARQEAHTPARRLLAWALMELGRFPEAVAAYDRYLEQGGTALAEIYRGRGRARMGLGDYAGAADDFTRALDLRPDAEVRLHRGWAYFFTDAHRLALRDFEEAVRLAPRGADAHVGRGLCRLRLGQYREAVADADEALRLRPDTPDMTHNAACIFAQAAARADGDREPLAEAYRRKAVEVIGQTLEQVPAADRANFWREKVSPEPDLEPIRHTAEYKRLARTYGGADK